MQNGELLGVIPTNEAAEKRSPPSMKIVAAARKASANQDRETATSARASIPFHYPHLAIARLDRNMEFLEVNQTFCRLVSYTSDQLLNGMTWYDVAPSHNTVTASRQLLADLKLAEGESLDVPHILQCGNGSIAEVITTFEAEWSPENIFMGALIMVFDVTIQRIQERELEEEFEKLERMKQDLMRAQSLASLGALVASVAEEILTPLRQGMELGQTLESTAAHLGEELEHHFSENSKSMQLSKRLDRGAHCMVQHLQEVMRLVGNFKKMAVDRSTSIIRKFSLETLLKEIVTTQSLVTRGRIQFNVQAEPNLIMHTFPGELEQVLSCLVENACDHGFPGKRKGTVTLIAKKVPTQDKVSLAIVDNGTGMSPRVAEHVFDPFFTTRESTGKGGLGLHIVHDLVTRQLKGHISLITRAGEGTEFNLIIPRTLADSKH